MRAFLLVLAILATAVGPAACGGDDGDESASSAATERASTATERASTAPKAATERSEPTTTAEGGPGGDDESADEPSGAEEQADGAPSDQPAGGSEDKEAAGAAVKSFFRAFVNGDGEEACSLLTRQVQKQFTSTLGRTPQFKGKSCDEIVPQLTSGYGETMRKGFEDVEILGVRGRGDTRMVSYRTSAMPRRVSIPVVKEDGEWKIGIFGGAPTAP